MRTLAILAALTGSPLPAHPPAPGLYCPLEPGGLPILVDERGIGIDGLDCDGPTYEGGRVTAAACFTNGGTRVPLDVGLSILPDGDLVHDRQFYRLRREGAPCPD